ncbi:MAG TPA: hypothetical protein VEC12_06705, partial [Bacteroidia bacterium]|nr:hypothetical protein [Bacteroidia bacterium]
MTKITLAVAALFAFTGLAAQMPNDGIFLVKGELCAVTTYHHSSWKKYWEGGRLRENSNIGTFRSQAIMPMAAYGITSRINVFAGLPYIWTKATDGTMAGQRGWQDFSIGVKGKFYELESGSIKTSVQGFAGYSLPVTNYVAN